MGDIARMMLDGTLCEGCGVPLTDDGDGIPLYCSLACAQDRGMPPAKGPAQTKPNPNSNRSKKRAARQFQQALRQRAEWGR